MNRIIIIGNGFDKAHNLPTGYGDFMNYLRDSIAKYEPTYRNQWKLINNGKECGNNRGYYHRLNNKKEDLWLGVQQIQNKPEFKLKTNPHSSEKSIYFKSLFEENEKLGYWSDLESHYFKLIISNKDSIEKIELINREFSHLKTLLFEYLKLEIDNKTGIGNEYDIHSINPIYDMLKLQHNDFEFEKNYFITFNYTSKILNQYLFWLRDGIGKEKFPLMPIHIHGDLTNPENPIIFGYGDENSKEYKELELLQNNRLLENFKTFQYLRSSKYNEVLGLLEESNEVYVQIIGHSSGLCDKALLRTIFQHENVKYIEPTYHKEESRYFENLYNISRIFDDNTIMRKKIIPLSETFKIE
ncbi:hypothetical protein G1K37_11900 [Tenacibaculum dicentrarchi]|nr:hypothetical protein [Tenacibaculum dicentrarchi]